MDVVAQVGRIIKDAAEKTRNEGGLACAKFVCFAIAVRPTGDDEGGHREAGEILANGTVLPEGVAALVLQPFLQEERLVLQPLQPHRLPAFADDFGIGRAGLVGEHGGGPGELGGKMRAVLVVDVVVVAIDGGGDGDDGLQRRRLQRGDLQAIEAAPGNAHHADRAVRPGLGGDPGDELAGIGEFKRRIFPVDDAVRFARAADLDAHAGNAGGGEDGIGRFVARARAVALAVGQEFEDGRHGIGLRAAGHPDAGGKPRPVPQRDPMVFDDGERALGHVACTFKKDSQFPALAMRLVLKTRSSQPISISGTDFSSRSV